ncbi:MAG: 3'-5' exonuclease, partial [Candidatus Promineifilaceae bacterium]
VGTYQSAKGLEFDTVFMPDCDQVYWPDEERLQEVGIDETSAEDARLLYVGITSRLSGKIV